MYPVAFRSVLAFNWPREVVIREARNRFTDNSTNLFGYENDNPNFNQSRVHVFCSLLTDVQWKGILHFSGHCGTKLCILGLDGQRMVVQA